MSLPPLRALGFVQHGDHWVCTVPRDLVMPTGSVISLRLVRPEAQDDFEVEYVATIETGKRDTAAAQLERDKEAAGCSVELVSSYEQGRAVPSIRRLAALLAWKAAGTAAPVSPSQ